MALHRKLRRRLQEQARHRFLRQKRRNAYQASPGLFDFAVVLDGLKPSYNVGKIFRSADAFGAAAVHLIGMDYFDPAPGKGSFKWVPAHFHASFADCHSELVAQGFTIFTLEPETGVPLQEVELPRKSCFVFGHEEFGLSFDSREFPDLKAIRIPQFGRVQSLNVSVAASVVMYEYSRQHFELSRPPTGD